jgi:hypothetical protein
MSTADLASRRPHPYLPVAAVHPERRHRGRVPSGGRRAKRGSRDDTIRYTPTP